MASVASPPKLQPHHHIDGVLISGHRSDLSQTQSKVHKHLVMSIPQERSPHAVIGEFEARSLAGQQMVDSLEQLTTSNPILGRNILQHGFGSSLALSGIGYREYALQTIGLLTAIGDCRDQLAAYVAAALTHGATEAEVLSVVNHAGTYTGFPRAVNTIQSIQPQLEAARPNSSYIPKESIISLYDHETIVRDTGGSGVPLILIHALGVDSQMFQKLIPCILTANPRLRIISYDLRGHGYARGAPETRSLEHLVADVVMLLEKLEIPRADVVGTSFGGAVAQYLAMMHPDRVRALCPMGAGAQGGPEFVSLATRAEAGEMADLRTGALLHWFRPDSLANNEWSVRYARAKLEHVVVSEWAAACRAMARMHALDRIKDLNCPVLVLVGSRDTYAPPERVKLIRQAFLRAGKQNCEYVEIENGTHMMAMEAFEDVSAALVAWRWKVDLADL